MQQGGLFPDDGIEGPLPGGGIGDARFQLGQGLLHGGVFQQDVGDAREGGGVGVLGPEAQAVHHPQPRQNIHGALGEALRRAEGIGRGQLQHQVGPLTHGSPGPGVLGQNGGFAPLDKVPGHTAHQGAVLSPRPVDGRQLVGVSPVKGVVFRDDPTDLHKNLRKPVVKPKKVV